MTYSFNVILKIVFLEVVLRVNMVPTVSSNVCVEMVDSAILRMEAAPVAWGGPASTVRKAS